MKLGQLLYIANLPSGGTDQQIAFVTEVLGDDRANVMVFPNLGIPYPVAEVAEHFTDEAAGRVGWIDPKTPARARPVQNDEEVV